MAQRTTNNPPFGYKFLGDVADDITELFNSLSSLGQTEQVKVFSDGSYWYINPSNEVNPGLGTTEGVKKGTIQIFKSDGSLAIEGTDYYLLGENGADIDPSDSIHLINWQVAGGPAVVYGVLGTGGTWDHAESGA